MPLGWPALLLLFTLSGFAALVYQIAWTREFAFVFGTSDLAVAAVLAGYFAGLAAGAAAAARLLPRLSRPLRAYAWLELAVGIFALAVPGLLHAAMQLHGVLFSSEGLEERGLASLLFYLLASLGILLIPTACMGATLPLLARHAVRRERELGRRVVLLYAGNTLGAVLGVVAAGFWLLPALGLAPTVWAAAGVNVAVWAAALGLARAASEPEASPAEPSQPVPPTPTSWILPVMAISGSISFLYEVLWTRLLTHLLGGSVYAFATMLASFLAGIALGAALAARGARTPHGAARHFVLAQLAAGLLSGVAYALLDRAPAWMARLGASTLPSASIDALLSAAILLPSAAAIGATFPLAVRILAHSVDEAGVASARVYAWNTVGSILGALGAGFAAIPMLGFEGAAALGIGANLALAAAVALRAELRPVGLGTLALAALVVLAVAPLEPPWRLLRSSPFAPTPAAGEVVYHGVGRNASVLLLDSEGEYLLRMNGLPEAAIQPPGGRAQRYSVAQWLGALPSLLRPETESLLVVGLGGGIALETVPASVRSVDVVEIEREALKANRAVSGRRRHDPLRDPRVRVHVNDARNALALTRRRFDAIVSQPSHPWTAGASHLYTQEFFERVRSRLAPDGVFVQWIGLQFVDTELLRTLIGTLSDVFPHVRAYRPARRPALLLAASSRPFASRTVIAREIERQPEAYAALGIFDVLDLEAAWWLDESGAREYGRDAPRNRDRRNRLEARSPHVVRSARRRATLEALLDHEALGRRAAAYASSGTVRRLVERGELVRARRLVGRTPPGAERAAARGLVLAAAGRTQRALRQLERALAQDPRHPEARAARLRLAAVSGGDPPAPPVASPLTPLESACFAAWRARQRGDWRGVRALEEPLAWAHPEEPLFRDAGRLRAWWRVRSGEPERAREALALLDPVVAGAERPGSLLLRAHAALQAGFPRGAVSTLFEVVASGALEGRPGLLPSVRALLGRLPRTPRFAGWRAALEARLDSLPGAPGSP